MTDQISKRPDVPAPRLSWNTHYLLTHIALQMCRTSLLDAETCVVPLEDFIAESRPALPGLIREYWRLLAKTGGSRSSANAKMADVTSVQDFLNALRLNPTVSIPYVRCITPEDVLPNTPHDPSRSGPPHGAYRETAQGASLDVREVLSVFSDEPDWGMDQDLFAVGPYGYGPVPFGSPTGKSSQASFHMAFLHENPLLVAVFPGLKKSFLEARVRGFLALAQVAFDSHVDYWGWRFTAWAMHYLQDLSQPYHARALPFPVWRVLARLLLYPYPRKFAEKHRNILINRHQLFESLVHLMLNNAVKQRENHPLVKALREHEEYYRGAVRTVMEHVSAVAAASAPRINRLLALLLNDPRIDQSDFFVSDEPSYPLVERLTAASVDRPAAVREFLELVSRCLCHTGMVTRYVVHSIGTDRQRL